MTPRGDMLVGVDRTTVGWLGSATSSTRNAPGSDGRRPVLGKAR